MGSWEITFQQSFLCSSWNAFIRWFQIFNILLSTLKKMLLWDTDGWDKIHVCYLNCLASYLRDTKTPFTYGFFQGEWSNISCFQYFLQMQNKKQNKTLWNFKSLNLLSNNPITFTWVSKTRWWISVPALCHTATSLYTLKVCK